jgi:hypothetical protein
MDIEWKKKQDWMDGSPRYVIKGRDPSTSIENITVVIYREREYPYRGALKKKYVWYGEIHENETECGDRLGPFTGVREAKKAMEDAFEYYLEKFSEAV